MTWTADAVGPTRLSSRHYALGALQVLELSGECDLGTRVEFRGELDHALNRRPTALIVDLTQVGFCDATCAGLTLEAAKHTQLAAVGLAGAAALVFDLLDPAEDLPRHRSVDEATRALELAERNPR